MRRWVPVRSAKTFIALLACCGLPTAHAVSQEKAAEKPVASVPAGLKGTLLSAAPGDTTFLIRVPSGKALVEKLKNSPLAQLQNHPDVKKLFDDLKLKAGPELEKAQKELGFNPVDTLLSVEGEWVLSIGSLNALASALSESLQMGQMPQSLSPETISIILAADAGASAGKVHEAFDKLFSFAEKNGAKRETSDFGGGKITRLSEPAHGAAAPKGEKKPSDDAKDGKKKEKSDLLPGPEDDKEKGKADKGSKKDEGDKDKDKDKDNDDDDGDEAPKASPPVNVYFGELGGRFYVSLNRGILEGCMQKPEAQRPDGLATSPIFQDTHGVTGAGDIFVFVNMKQLTASIGNALSSTFFAFFWQKFEAIFLGASLNNVGVSYSLEPAGMTQMMFVHNAGASDGLLGVFKGEAFSPASPVPVPADSQTFSSLSFNASQLSKIVKDTVQLIMSFQGQSADIDALVEGQVGVKFTDIMSAMGKRIHSFSGSKISDNPLAGVNYVVELKDDSPLKKVLKKVSEMSQGQFDAEKFKDRDIYSLDTPSFGLNVSAADKLLILSTSRSDVEKVINRAGDANAASPGGDAFKAAAKTMPAQVSMVGYSSPDYFKILFQSILGKLDNVDPEAEPFLKALGALAELMGAGSGYGVWKDKGFFTTSRAEFAKK